MLDKIICEKGVFDGISGVVYADEVIFSASKSLLVVSAHNSSLICEVYDNTDGMQCTDILTVPYSQHGTYTLSVAETAETSRIILQINKSIGFYTISDDTFTQTEKLDYSTKTDIISVFNGKPHSYKTRRDLYNFLNSLKKSRINDYKMPNIINTISDSEKQNIMKTIAACADIMGFDIRKYDYDKLMKHILCSNQNFKILTDIPSRYADSGELSIVSAEYIDYILKNIFALTPEHPEVNLLTRRGFCVDNGYYYYKNNFGYYATDILNAEGIYDLGSDMYYVVFSDIFRSESSAVPEYSYAAVQKADGIFRLVKLGMGKDLLFENELHSLSPNMKSSYEWERTAPETAVDKYVFAILIMACISCGAASVICGIIYVIKTLF